jgi:plastocyanin
MSKLSQVARSNFGKSGFGLALCLLFLLSCSKSIPAPDIQTKTIIHVIEIKKFQFSPQTLVVRSGDFVRWENKDIVPHQIAEKTLKKWSSQILLPKDSFTLQIKDSTSYICKLHPVMQAEFIIGLPNH